MGTEGATNNQIDPLSFERYQEILTILNKTQVPFLLGGAYAFERYTGIARHTKDLDIFVRPSEYQHITDVLADHGYQIEHTYHWLGKAYCGDDFIDIIFRSNNSVAEVDDLWFDHAVESTVCDVPVKLCPPEEILWTKALIMERERYDGADVAHLLRACAKGFDWQRLLQRFAAHWRVLLSHLILFGFIYPAERAKIPNAVMKELLDRLQQELISPPPTEQLCQGTLLSREQYLTDIEKWGYRDARIEPVGNMTEDEVAQWTEAIEDEQEE